MSGPGWTYRQARRTSAARATRSRRRRCNAPGSALHRRRPGWSASRVSGPSPGTGCEELLAPLGPVAVLSLDLLEERRQLLVARLASVVDIHLARLSTLERVIEHADQVVVVVRGTGC